MTTIYSISANVPRIRRQALQKPVGKFDSYGGCHFLNTLGEGNERSLTGKATARYAGVIQFESESIVEVVSNVLTLIDIEGYNLTRL